MDKKLIKKISLIFFVLALAISVRAMAAFSGPPSSPSSAPGAITTDGSGNVGIGVGAVSSIRLEVKGSGTTSGTFGLKVINSSSTPTFTVRDDGLIIVAASGIMFSDNSTLTTAAGLGGGATTTDAGYVSPGTFNSLTGLGNATYYFPTNAAVKGSLSVGTSTAPGYTLDVAGGGKFTGTLLANGGINMNSASISAVNKLTVTTIDPLYRIGGVNYATYAGSFAGGVKEEYSGRAEFAPASGSGEYEYVIDFGKEPVGSDLWVWYRAVDFVRENIEAVATPYGRFANIYYVIDGSKLIFRSDKLAEFSFRLTGRRHDWREWPTKAKNQTEVPSFIIE